MKEIEGQQRRGGPIVQPVVSIEGEPKAYVQPGRRRNGQKAERHRQRKAEAEPHQQERAKLACDRKPPQPNQRIDAQPPRIATKIDDGEVRHFQTIGRRAANGNGAAASPIARR